MLMSFRRAGAHFRANPATIGGRRRRLRRVFGSTVASAVVVSVSIAGAQWLSAGTGSGFAKARNAEPLRTVSAEASPMLYPGGTGDLTLTVANDNPYDINLMRVEPNGTATSGVAACDDPGNGVSFATVSGTWLVPRNGSGTFVLPGSVSMSESSPDACQGQTFAIQVRLAGEQRTGPIAPRLELTPTSATFPDQEVGTTGAAQRFTVRNVGNAGTTDLAAVLAGTEASSYLITANTCTQLAQGASCAIDVAARPTKRGTLAGELRVSAAGQAQMATLTVKGLQALVVGFSNHFGNVTVGQSRTIAVRVQNFGDATSGPFSSIRFGSGSVTPEGTFTILGSTCGAPLAPGATCTVDLRFTPPAQASYGGSLITVAIPGTPSGGHFAVQQGNGV